MRPTQKTGGPLWCCQLTQSTGVFSLRLSYCETNKENWRAFLGFLTYTILQPTQKTGMPFFISSIVRTTQNTDFFIRVYIIVRSTQKTGGPFFRMIFILLCYQHKVLTFFCIWDYIIVRPTQKTGVPFLVLIYSIMWPTHKTGVHSSC